jgi:hypothetical protein
MVVGRLCDLRLVYLLFNEDAVVGLPLRLVVCLVIGMAALYSILGLMTQRDLIPRPMVVSVSPMFGVVGNGSQNVSFVVSVQDAEGGGVDEATVLLSGLGGAGIARTNGSGAAVVALAVRLEPGVCEGYLDVGVTAVGRPRFVQESMVKVVRGS